MEQNEKQPTFLTFQGHITIQSNAEGEQIYEELKTFVKSWGEEPFISGQIIHHMEPCCDKSKKGKQNASIRPFLQR